MLQISFKKNTLLKAMLLIAAAAFISGCASMGKDECLTANWQMIGYEDGSKGQPASRIGEHRKACAKHGVQPDMEAYTAGRNDGLKEFCRPDRGYQYGLQGNVYGGVCPRELEGPYNNAYTLGRNTYLAGKKVISTQKSIKNTEQKIENTKKLISVKEAQIINGNLSSLARRNLMDETKELTKSLGTLEEKKLSLEKDLALQQNKYAELKQQSF